MTSQRPPRPPPLPAPRDPSWRAVRVNRRRARWWIGIGASSAPVGYLALSHTIEPSYYLPWALVLLGTPSWLLLLGFLLLLEYQYFEYDIDSCAIRGNDPWGADIVRRWRRERGHPWDRGKGAYPQMGFIRLEYSVALAEIYQVREDGSREKLWIRAKWAERSDWEAFVRHLQRFGAVIDTES